MYKVLMLLVALALPFGPAYAADWPDRPVKLIVPFAPGGETDLCARLLGEAMSRELGQTVVVQNVTGALGLTGIQEILSSKPDGYTYGVVPSAPLTVFPHTRKLGYTLDSFAYLGRIMTSPYFLVTSRNSPWNSPADVAEACKARPGTYFYSTSGQASIPHLSTFGFLTAAGADMKAVNLASNADTAHAFASDRVQLFSATWDFVVQNDIKALAVMSPERLPSLPDVPSIQESGYESYIEQFLVVVGPQGIPADIAARFGSVMEKALQDPKVVESYGKFYIRPAYLNAVDTRAFVEQVSAGNAVLVKELLK